MNWKVVWKPDAERRLTTIWLADRMRQRIADAANEIDTLLAADPLNAGESREDNDRVLFAKPLGALVEVLQDERTVNVLEVWRY
jgi:hypothetical protein